MIELTSINDIREGMYLTERATETVGWILERVAEGIVTVARYAGGKREVRFERWSGFADFATRYARTSPDAWQNYLDNSNAWGRCTLARS